MIRVLIVDQVRLMCNLIGAVLSKEPEFQVVGSATSVAEALYLADKCDIVLVSNSLPDVGALELTRILARRKSTPRAVVIGLAECEPALLRHIEAGAAGYVLKEDSVADMCKTIQAAYKREAFVSPGVAALLMNRVSELSEWRAAPGGRYSIPATPPTDLTRRERQVLSLIAQGYCNQEIAQQLAIELGTAKNHVHNILDKLNVSTRRDAAAYAGLAEARAV